jgi:MFS family permease
MADMNPATAFLRKFTVLNGAARELWITFIVKFLSVAAYAVTNLTIKLWLSSEFGCSDKEALALVLAWSLTMTGVTLLVGSLTDALGLRRTFFLGVWVCLAARLVMVFATNKWLAVVGGLFPLAIGEALGTPVLVAAVRQYSTTRQRSISFSTVYMMMNVGFLVAGYVFDALRNEQTGLGEHGHFVLPVLNITITTYRALFLLSWVLELSLLPFVWYMRAGVEVTDEGLKIAPAPPATAGGNIWNAFQLTVRNAVVDTVRLFAGLFKQRSFYRLLAFLGLIACLKLILMQMYYVFPTFGIRELGKGAPVGTLWNINSWLIIFLVPLVGALTQRFPAYGMAILGGAISAGSVFVMAMPTAWFQSAAGGVLGEWVGHWYLNLSGQVHPYYVMIALFVTLFSIGEAFYSPRVYEYAAAIAPKGQEASYSSLSYIPLLLGKVFTTMIGGALLSNYCPEVGERHSGTMWLVIALLATICPVGLLVLRPYIRVHEAGRED